MKCPQNQLNTIPTSVTGTSILYQTDNSGTQTQSRIVPQQREDFQRAHDDTQPGHRGDLFHSVSFYMSPIKSKHNYTTSKVKKLTIMRGGKLYLHSVFHDWSVCCHSDLQLI